VYSSKYHCVWTPKYRRSVLVGPIAKRCEQVMRQTAEKYRAEIIALEITPDHVHVLVEVDPQFRHPPIGQESQGSLIAHIAARVSHLEIAATHTLDESLFGIHGGRGTTGGDKAIC
jgi:REP element-mobilizing transposase RayT